MSQALRPITETNSRLDILSVLYHCPKCLNDVGLHDRVRKEWAYQYDICSNCGQKIDWSDVEENMKKREYNLHFNVGKFFDIIKDVVNLDERKTREVLQAAVFDCFTAVPKCDFSVEHKRDDEIGSIDYSVKADKGKYRPTLCHQSLIEAVSRVRMFGASRYGGEDTWKRVEEQRYRDALYRHWLAYLENPDGVDEESGLPHLYHAACNLDFLVEMQKERLKNG